jgi:hypothetical protein
VAELVGEIDHHPQMRGWLAVPLIPTIGVRLPSGRPGGVGRADSVEPSLSCVEASLVEIAAELVISVKTASVHVLHIPRKL